MRKKELFTPGLYVDKFPDGKFMADAATVRDIGLSPRLCRGLKMEFVLEVVAHIYGEKLKIENYILSKKLGWLTEQMARKISRYFSGVKCKGGRHLKVAPEPELNYLLRIVRQNYEETNDYLYLDKSSRGSSPWVAINARSGHAFERKERAWRG